MKKQTKKPQKKVIYGWIWSSFGFSDLDINRLSDQLSHKKELFTYPEQAKKIKLTIEECK